MLGKKMSRWLSRPGADMSVVSNLVRKHGVVRGLATTLEGEFGSNVEVEISAAGDKPHKPDHIGLLVRDVTSRGEAIASQIAPHAEDLIEVRFDNLTLDQIVKASTEVIERKSIAGASAASGGNRAWHVRNRLGLKSPEFACETEKVQFGRKIKTDANGIAPGEAMDLASNQGAFPAFGAANLSNCEREQIHLAGSIQPHGALLLVRKSNCVIVQASVNAAEFLGIKGDLLGTHLLKLGGNLCERVRPHLADVRDAIPVRGAMSPRRP